uniref:TMEM175 family protein n=1 Tax=Cyanobium sp. TaxID=2164130 RepID=UPI004047798E
MSLALASRRMIFNRSIRHHTLRANALLPFFDAIFAVALTLLAFNVPEMLHGDTSHVHLFGSILAYCLTGLIVILYWFKLRRLIGVCRFLHVPQLLCLGQAILTICLFPKMANLVLLYGSQGGLNISNYPGSIGQYGLFGGALFVQLALLDFCLVAHDSPLLQKGQSGDTSPCDQIPAARIWDSSGHGFRRAFLGKF